MTGPTHLRTVLLLVLLASLALLSCSSPLPATVERSEPATPDTPEATALADAPEHTIIATSQPEATSSSEAAAAAPTAATSSAAPLPQSTETAPRTYPTPAPHPGSPLGVFFSDDFVGSGVCADCHSLLQDRSGEDVSIDTHWRSTMMANAAKDPVWQAKVSMEAALRPDLGSVIEDKCATCHTSMARTQSLVLGSPVKVLGDGYLATDHPLHEAAMDGVSCTLCHQIEDAGLGDAETFSGGYPIDTSTEPPYRLAFGPYPDPFTRPMAMHSGFLAVEGSHIGDSGLCATCHTLFTPVIDNEGNEVGEFAEQTPYLEWEHSLFGGEEGTGVSCQDCHMPDADGPVRISNHPPGGPFPDRSPFARHFFVGGNATMLTLLQGNIEALGLTASTADLQATLERTVQQLQHRSATISINSIEIEGPQLSFGVDVHSLAGHKLPTGYPARQAWLHVAVTGASGEILFESGHVDADGSISGNDADDDASTFEPHHDLLSSPDQVQIYETVMRGLDGEVTQVLLSALSYAKDNRLLPVGFDPASADESIAVYGEASLDSNFVGGSDSVRYAVDAEGASGPFTISAELLYRPFSRQYVQDVAASSTDEAERFIAMYSRSKAAPVILAQDYQTFDEASP